jgi:hypothetical protein
MSLILEQIIRHILLEQRTVAKIKSISDKIKNLAKADGAVMAYAVKVNGTSDPGKIKQLVIGATMASTGDESESSEPVGAGSKYGRTTNSTSTAGAYRYVMSQPISKKNQLIYVWIIPNKLNEYENKLPKKDDVIDVAGERFLKIGFATFEVVNEYNSAVEEYNKYAKQSNLPQLTTLKNLNSVKSQELLNEPEKDASSSATDSEQDTIDNTDVDMNVDTSLQSEPRKNITYPYETTTDSGEKYIIYTLSDSDENVYTYGDGQYFKANKEQFERGMVKDGEPVTDQQTIKKLNALTGQSVTPGVQTKEQPKQPESDKKNKETVKDKPKDKEKQDTEKKNTERKFKSLESLTLSKTTLYEYNVTNNTYKKIGTYDPARGKESAEYRRMSTDKKYIQVYFKKSKVLVWVPYNSVK